MFLPHATRIAAVVAFWLMSGAVGFAQQKYEGEIHSVSEHQIVLMISTELMTFKLDKNTAITLNGKSAKATHLKSGDAASLHAEKGDDAVFRATTVTATRSPSAAINRAQKSHDSDRIVTAEFD